MPFLLRIYHGTLRPYDSMHEVFENWGFVNRCGLTKYGGVVGRWYYCSEEKEREEKRRAVDEGRDKTDSQLGLGHAGVIRVWVRVALYSYHTNR